MANSILGAGIVGLPYAVREAGFVTGILLLVVLGAVTSWTVKLMGACFHHSAAHHPAAEYTQSH